MTLEHITKLLEIGLPALIYSTHREAMHPSDDLYIQTWKTVLEDIGTCIEHDRPVIYFNIDPEESRSFVTSDETGKEYRFTGDKAYVVGCRDILTVSLPDLGGADYTSADLLQATEEMFDLFFLEMEEKRLGKDWFRCAVDAPLFVLKERVLEMRLDTFSGKFVNPAA